MLRWQLLAESLAWGLLNNLTRKASLANPLQTVVFNGLIAGPVNLLIGLAAGRSMPAFTPIVIEGVVRFLGYRLSLALSMLALRQLGAARTGAYLSTAPFIGAAAALVVLQEPVTVHLMAAGLLIGIGVWLHLREDHDREHEPIEHTHRHVHDAHHQHSHDPDDQPGEPHTHYHRHLLLRHKHPHVPSMYHTHGH